MGRYSRRLIGGYAALLGAAAVVILVMVLTRPSGGGPANAVHRAAPANPKAAPTTLAHSSAKAKPAARPKAKRAAAAPRAAKPVHVGPLPLAGHVKPWRGDGTSYVASVRSRWLAVYSAPRPQRPSLFLRNHDQIGSPRALLVHTERKHWVRVFLPRRPNGVTGWIPRKAVRLLKNPYRIQVRLRAHRLVLWKGDRVVLRTRTVVGKPSTPTPTGTFFVTDLLRPSDPNGAYGPYAFNLSAHSRVFFHFAGGDGVVAIHGTDAPWLLGQSASHGCVRVGNPVIRRLARVLPLGTPVVIRR
jgi:lipoprotein-anchoring transpeptidase ErfK/SrfK